MTKRASPQTAGGVENPLLDPGTAEQTSSSNGSDSITEPVRSASEAEGTAWSHDLAVGQPLPILPSWLSRHLVVPLNLEFSYEQACNDLWIA